MVQRKIILIGLLILLLSGCSKSNNDKINTGATINPSITEEVSPTKVAEKQTSYPANPTKSVLTEIPTATASPSFTPTDAPSTNSDNTQIAKEILEAMSLEEKVGQLFFVRCNNDTAVNDISTYHLGGMILFSENFEDKTKNEVIETISEYQSITKIPLLIGVDEEGGTVNRISKFSTFRAVPFKSPQELYKLGGFDLIISDTIEKADLLLSLGVNVNLAPVCDISTNPNNFIYNRSFGKKAKETSEYVRTVVSTMNSQEIGSTLKHFPGYGNNVDTHTEIAIDQRSLDTFMNNDFLPFEAGIDAGTGSILVSHTIVTCLDTKHPASLSPAVHNILRNDLSFQGVIMTDDLSMDAIKQYTNEETAGVLAVIAGNDLIIASDFNVQIPAVINAVKNHKIKEERINESVMRILLWKLSLGILPE